MGRKNAVAIKKKASKDKLKRKEQTKKSTQLARAKKERQSVKRKRSDTQEAPPAKRQKKETPKKVVQKPGDDGEEDIVLEEEDLQFFAERGGGLLTLMESLETDPQSKKVRGRKMKQQKKEDKNTPAEWEETRSNKQWKEEDTQKLPIKHLDGTIVQARIKNPVQTAELPEQDEEDEEGEEGDEEEGDYSGDEDDELEILEETVNPSSYGPETPEQMKVRVFFERQRHSKEYKEKLAQLASDLLENPERTSRFAEFRQMCNEESDPVLKKYTILTEVAIFKDLIPDYKIRLPTDEEMKVKLSDDVAKVRNFEKGLLNAYQAYLGYLESLIKGAPKKDYEKNAPSNTVAAIAVKCMGRLLVDVPHFNFRSNIIVTLIPLADSKSDHISDLAITSFSKLFRFDKRTDATLEACKKIAKFIKSKAYKVRPEILQSFMSLPLNQELPEGTDLLRGITPKKMSKKAKKRNKDDMLLEKEMNEARADLDQEHYKYIQTEVVKVVFLTYFRILKHTEKTTLLPAVLEGLARFCHLINVELLLDVLALLRQMIKREDDEELDTASKIHCAITAFQTYKQQGQALALDLKEFYTTVYSTLWNVLSESVSNETIIPSLIRCLSLMFDEQRLLAQDRIAAFIKRLLTISLYVPPNAALAFVSIVKNLLEKYPRTQQLLDNEFKGTGVYMPELDDPEHCNAFATTAWEFSLLTLHPHKPLAQFSRLVGTSERVEGAQTPFQLYQYYQPNTEPVEYSTGKGVSYSFPEIPEPPVHPIEKQMEKLIKKQGTKDKDADKVWFVKDQFTEPSPFLVNLQEQGGASPTPNLFGSLWKQNSGDTEESSKGDHQMKDVSEVSEGKAEGKGKAQGKANGQVQGPKTNGISRKNSAKQNAKNKSQ